jgi:glycine oxidase
VNGLYRHGYMIVPEVADEAVRFAAALLDGRIGDADAFADYQRGARWSELFQLDSAREPA